MIKKLFSNRIMKFATTGVANTAVDFGIFWLLLKLSVSLIPANIISVVSAILFSFMVNRKWTFSDRNNGINKLIPYFLFTGIGIILNTFLLNSIVNVSTPLLTNINADSIAMGSKFVASLATMIYNYLVYNYIVFKKVEIVDENND